MKVKPTSKLEKTLIVIGRKKYKVRKGEERAMVERAMVAMADGNTQTASFSISMFLLIS